MKIKVLGLACCLAASIGAATQSHAATEQNKSSSAVLLQGFHWNSHQYGWYNIMKGKASDMQSLGITHVWFPPPSDAASSEGYLPRQLNKLDSNYGSKSQLKSAITALNNKGIKAVADIVVNHRVGTTNWGDFTNPTWGSWSVTRDDEWTGSTGNWDTGDGYAAARDLDHTNTGVQDGIKSWMNNVLKDVGFSGWRYDYSKGYSPYYAKVYHDGTNPNFCVGEVWTNLYYNDVDAHRKQLMDYVDGTQGSCAAFDFTTKGLLNKALSSNEYWRLKDGSGKPAGGIGWWPQKMVTFVDNHDTGPSQSCGVGQNHWPVPCDKVMQGYAYILTHPGIPTVYWPHVYDWGLRGEIKNLIDIRKRAGLTSTSSVNVKASQNGLYAAIIGGKVAMKIGPNNWSPGSGWQLSTFGNNFAVWEKK
ncbi:glucan 1,4-alpha-maltotetraohydrolase domain-containing protein [Corallincola luteus]|nr:glucan 1,4-alpha-maltotetraohydrolase domain-containing protein [Corallincola luteus]